MYIKALQKFNHFDLYFKKRPYKKNEAMQMKEVINMKNLKVTPIRMEKQS